MTPRVDTTDGPYSTHCPDCGWYSTLTRTQGLADAALRRHSCERTRRISERQARGTTRRAIVDRSPKPCRHKAGHVHGTRACYVFDKCRCLPCAKAQREYENRRLRERAYGRARLVDAEAARDHVRQLMAQGMGRRRIAEVAGVKTSTITRLLYGIRAVPPSERIKPQTEQALLAVQLDLAAGAVVDGLGTIRRLQALVAAGWTQTEIARRLGVTNANLGALIHTRTQVLRATADKVTALYEEISECAPPVDVAPHATRVADRRGWAPPICWDEDTIDDPLAEPNWTGFDETLVRGWLDNNAAPHGAGPEELVEVNRRLMDYGFTVRQAVIITGLPRDEVQVMRNFITRQERESGMRRRVYKEAM